MLLPEIKEREYRFRLALRMGLPIFTLLLGVIYTTYSSSFETLTPAFYFQLILLFVFSVYFLFFLIYNGFEMQITENVSKTFTREYLYKYLKNDIKNKKDYSLILISINNLHSINESYGLKNGDKVLANLAKLIGEYFKEKGIVNFPLGHIKGGDFILGLDGSKDNYKTVLELFELKCNDCKIDNIELKISTAINDTNFSKSVEHLVENLFDIQSNSIKIEQKDEVDPSELELSVIDAIKKANFITQTQDIFANSDISMKEHFIKLKSLDDKVIYPKIYMKVLNQLDLMLDYDLMIFEDVFMQNYDFKNTIVLSISPTSIRNYKFIEKVKELMRDYPDANGKIMFMLFESSYYHNIKRYNQTLQTLRKLGIKIAVDRLGSIDTSFLYLRDLEIDAVRFDGYYLKDKHLEKYEYILKGFTMMASQKGVKSWVKLIEDENSKSIAQSLGIDYMQGKYLSKLK